MPGNGAPRTAQLQEKEQGGRHNKTRHQACVGHRHLRIVLRTHTHESMAGHTCFRARMPLRLCLLQDGLPEIDNAHALHQQHISLGHGQYRLTEGHGHLAGRIPDVAILPDSVVRPRLSLDFRQDNESDTSRISDRQLRGNQDNIRNCLEIIHRRFEWKKFQIQPRVQGRQLGLSGRKTREEDEGILPQDVAYILPRARAGKAEPRQVGPASRSR